MRWRRGERKEKDAPAPERKGGAWESTEQSRVHVYAAGILEQKIIKISKINL